LITGKVLLGIGHAVVMAPGATKGRSRIGVGRTGPAKAFHLYKNLLRDVTLASASQKEAQAHSRGANKQLN
jgi:hypothetical protein